MPRKKKSSNRGKKQSSAADSSAEGHHSSTTTATEKTDASAAATRTSATSTTTATEAVPRETESVVNGKVGGSQPDSAAGAKKKTKKQRRARGGAGAKKKQKQQGVSSSETASIDSAVFGPRTASSGEDKKREAPDSAGGVKLSAEEYQQIKAPKLTHWLGATSQHRSSKSTLYDFDVEHQLAGAISSSSLEAIREALHSPAETFPYPYDSLPETIEELLILYQGSHAGTRSFFNCLESGNFAFSFYCSALFTTKGVNMLHKVTPQPMRTIRGLWSGLFRNIGMLASRSNPVLGVQIANLFPSLTVLANEGYVPEEMREFNTCLAEDMCYSWLKHFGGANVDFSNAAQQMEASKVGRLTLLACHLNENTIVPLKNSPHDERSFFSNSLWEQRLAIQNVSYSFDGHPYLYGYLSAMVQRWILCRRSMAIEGNASSRSELAEHAESQETEIATSVQTPHLLQLESHRIAAGMIEKRTKNVAMDQNQERDLCTQLQTIWHISRSIIHETELLKSTIAAEKAPPPSSMDRYDALQRLSCAQAPSRQSLQSSYFQCQGLVAARFCNYLHQLWNAASTYISSVNMGALLSHIVEAHESVVGFFEESYRHIAVSSHFFRQPAEYANLLGVCNVPVLPDVPREHLVRYPPQVFLYRGRQIWMHLFQWLLAEWNKPVENASSKDRIDKVFRSNTVCLLERWCSFERNYGDTNTTYQVSNFLENISQADGEQRRNNFTIDEEEDTSAPLFPSLEAFDQYVSHMPGIDYPIPAALPEAPKVHSCGPEEEVDSQEYNRQSLDVLTCNAYEPIEAPASTTVSLMGVGSTIKNLEQSGDRQSYKQLMKNVAEALGKKRKGYLRRRPDYFIGVRVPSSQLWKDAEELQKQIVQKRPELSSCVIPVSEMHMSLVILSLPDQESVDRAIKLFQSMEEYVLEAFEVNDTDHTSAGVQVAGVDVFPGSRVLFAKPRNNATLLSLSHVAELLYMIFSAVGYTSDFSVLFDRLSVSQMLKRKLNVTYGSEESISIPKALEDYARPSRPALSEGELEKLSEAIKNMDMTGATYEEVIDAAVDYMLPIKDLKQIKKRYQLLSEETEKLLQENQERGYLSSCSNSDWKAHMTLLKLSKYKPRGKAKFVFSSAQSSIKHKKRPRSIPNAVWDGLETGIAGFATIFRIEMNRMERGGSNEEPDGYYKSVSHIYLPGATEDSFDEHLENVWNDVKAKVSEAVMEDIEEEGASNRDKTNHEYEDIDLEAQATSTATVQEQEQTTTSTVEQANSDPEITRTG
eukprot:gb/GECG01001204.1/.p1 GENE.gb/GECG01001204.1/~~gb/GECG01001204.1/.p1  ORF type:complete len:1273 (+),score=188.15 gb/GECG01001204.1/:1-3819(+)